MEKEIKHLNEQLDQALKDYEELQKIIDKAIEFIQNHNKKAGALYYKYNNRYLLSEIKEELLVILMGEE